MVSKFALVGKNISHSKSPYVYNELFKLSLDYRLLDFSTLDELEKSFPEFNQFDGLNITAPYKSWFFQKVTNLHVSSIKTGSVNCLYKVDGEFIGANTDYLALRRIIKRLESFDHCYILGNGAMAKTVQVIFDEYKVPYHSYYRKKKDNMNDLSFIESKGILIMNCCARGYIFSSRVNSSTTFYDLNYEHKENKNNVESCNAKYIDGFDLLVEQARQAVKLWRL